jgi:hypothetical protein
MTDRDQDYYHRIIDQLKDENEGLRRIIEQLQDPIIRAKMMQPAPPVMWCTDCPHVPAALLDEQKRAQSAQLQDTATKSA